MVSSFIKCLFFNISCETNLGNPNPKESGSLLGLWKFFHVGSGMKLSTMLQAFSGQNYGERTYEEKGITSDVTHERIDKTNNLKLEMKLGKKILWKHKRISTQQIFMFENCSRAQYRTENLTCDMDLPVK
ncbi:unnamed protein product [Acanthoscelides obtectus]|uniref:Uncharacterized protein n=1 Tax=Acanthoscelides obtectus TaxID=200917 RepID=A0A9P0Q8P7_ACAOB|nr:unnamed protein product [Acanthoscelides obtectus]CAK1622516.1 hypothetical protein AOBTE_LOCUS1534 [Acanthoscelides obtectus]